MLFWLTLGIAIGIFIPAPYDELAKSWFRKAVAWVKGQAN